MAQHNLIKLASQGRAYDASRAWTEDELTALITLETERGLARTVAADFIRNGIRTVEDYDAAVKAGFAPKSLEDLRTDAIAAHAASVRAELGLIPKEEVVVDEVKEVEAPKEVEVPKEPEGVKETEVSTEGVLETDEVLEGADTPDEAEVPELEEDDVPVKETKPQGKGGNKATKAK